MNEEIIRVEDDESGIRIDKYLGDIYTDISRSRFQKLILEGYILVNGLKVKNKYQVQPGDEIIILESSSNEVDIVAEDIPLDILYEDDDIIVVNKPKNMVVHPAPGHYTGTLVNALMFHCKDSLSGINGEIRPGIVHRIDMNTTGSLIVCKNDFAHNSIALQIKEHSVNRIYEGIVKGNVKSDKGTIEGPIGRNPKDRMKMAINHEHGKPAITHYEVINRYNGYTHCRFKLETGRTHQIRVHMSSIGHPLLNDDLYGGQSTFKHLQGQCLHAKTIGFIHPRSKEYIEVEAPLPEYFLNLLNIL
ncbi:MAG: RluA family pseudouridine synthase [Pseudobutyrivibrio sp.]|nr:RluA family pseudouridine synthase [Clostridia bacterium]MCF0130150.1 RluA family pseudouridine synthase [Pseudobutyrivibrio sp.]